MGLFNKRIAAAYGAPTVVAQPPALSSPFSTSDSLEAAIVGDIFGELPNEVITPEIALRVPEVNRALQAHNALVAPLKFEVYRDGEKVADQPQWVTSSAYGVPTFIRNTGVVSDLFLFGWALLGAELGADGLPSDLLYIPRNFWVMDEAGSITVDPAIPSRYTQRLIPIPLGSRGLLVDGIDSIRQARKLELARQARIDAPPAATELHLTNAIYDEMTNAEKAALSKSYAESRNKFAVSVTPSYIDVKEHNGQAVDLFESGMNSLRLQLAMHSGVPASFLEAGKEGGANGQMTYTNDNGKASELWVFGSARFAYAITARLSMDDVVGPGAEVRADLSDFMVPAPQTLSPESPVTASEPVEITE